MKTSFISIASLLVLAALSGCGQATDNPVSASITPVSIDGSQFLLADEPEDAVGVIEARESAKDGEPVVIVGRIGGAANPWVEGRAAFMLLDASKLVVAEGDDSAEDEMCTGDCCATERAGCTTLVKIVDASGKVIAADSRQLLGLTSDDMVVVRGKAAKDASDNFTVLADGVYIRR